MSWFKEVLTDKSRIKQNMQRIAMLINKFNRIKKMLFGTQSGAFSALSELIEDKLIKSEPKLKYILSSILRGENNQKVVLDSPHRAEEMIDKLILILAEKSRLEKNTLAEKGEINGL